MYLQELWEMYFQGSPANYESGNQIIVIRAHLRTSVLSLYQF